MKIETSSMQKFTELPWFFWEHSFFKMCQTGHTLLTWTLHAALSLPNPPFKAKYRLIESLVGSGLRSAFVNFRASAIQKFRCWSADVFIKDFCFSLQFYTNILLFYLKLLINHARWNWGAILLKKFWKSAKKCCIFLGKISENAASCGKLKRKWWAHRMGAWRRCEHRSQHCGKKSDMKVVRRILCEQGWMGSSVILHIEDSFSSGCSFPPQMVSKIIKSPRLHISRISCPATNLGQVSLCWCSQDTMGDGKVSDMFWLEVWFEHLIRANEFSVALKGTHEDWSVCSFKYNRFWFLLLF